jgi:hypothetical protein
MEFWACKNRRTTAQTYKVMKLGQTICMEICISFEKQFMTYYGAVVETECMTGKSNSFHILNIIRPIKM